MAKIIDVIVVENTVRKALSELADQHSMNRDDFVDLVVDGLEHVLFGYQAEQDNRD